MREELLAGGAPDAVVDDAVLVLSELLSNSCRHARPLRGDAYVTAAWSREPEGELRIAVTDGGGPTRPLPATPSITARGGRGLAIISALARDWGVSEEIHDDELPGEPGWGEQVKGVTVWVLLSARERPGRVPDTAVELGVDPIEGLDGLDGALNSGAVHGHGTRHGVPGGVPAGTHNGIHGGNCALGDGREPGHGDGTGKRNGARRPAPLPEPLTRDNTGHAPVEERRHR